MLPEFFKFFLPTRTIYGAGLTDRLAPEVAFLGKKKALVLSDQVLKKLGLVDKVIKGLEGSQIEIAAEYIDIPPNSTIKTVEDAAKLGKEKGCDLLIAIGGGSVMDTAKVVNVVMFKGGSVEDHMGAQLLDAPIYPCICIPTTAGTGSEITQYAVISDTDNDVKLPFQEEEFLPTLSVLDPEMTVKMPPNLTAATGMDALTHAIECYISREANPISDALALGAIEMIGANILQAAADPEDIDARGGMLVASFMAAMAFGHAGVGIVHGVSHALGGVYHIPHGLANSIILPLGMEYNLETSTGRLAKIGEALGEIPLNPVRELSKRTARFDVSAFNQAIDQLGFVDEWLTEQRAKGAIAKVRRLNQQLSYIGGFATNLRDAGIKDNLARLDELVVKAMEDGSMLYNPRDVEPTAVRQIIIDAHDQDLPPIKVSAGERRIAKSNVSKKKIKGVFKDAEQLYEVLLGFFDQIRDNESMYNDLYKSKLSVRFNYRNPESAIAIDARNDGVNFLKGEDARSIDVDVEMSMEADFAHYFWHGEANILQALARREVVTKGNVPKALRLLPVLEPAYNMYPKFLRERDLANLVVS